MNEDISILESLPAKHRQHLLAAHQAALKSAKNRHEKIQMLVELLDDDVLASYPGLYVAGNGRLFTWYLNRDLAISSDAIEGRIAQKYERAGVGEKPTVAQGESPKFHRITRLRETVRLEYVYYGGTVIEANGWDQTTLLRYRFPVVIVRQEPFTLEFRRAPTGIRQSLLDSVREDLGIAPDSQFIMCKLDEDSLRSALEQRLDATFMGEQRIGRARGLGSFSISTNRKVALYNQVDYLRNRLTPEAAPNSEGDLSHHVVHARSWSFLTRHERDEYMEEADYTIVVETGDIRISDGASETAIENLRRNVLELF